MEHKHDVRSHSLVGYDNLLTPIDNEIAALIKHALLCLLRNIQIVHVLEVTEVRANHDRCFPEEDIDRGKLLESIELASLSTVVIVVSVLLFHHLSLVTDHFLELGHTYIHIHLH